MSALPNLVVLGLGAVALAAIGCAIVAVVPAHWLLGLYYIAQLSQEKFTVSGVTVDAIDVTFGFVGLAVLVQGLPRSPRTAIPHVGLWVVLATFLALSYAASPSGDRRCEA